MIKEKTTKAATMKSVIEKHFFTISGRQLQGYYSHPSENFNEVHAQLDALQDDLKAARFKPKAMINCTGGDVIVYTDDNERVQIKYHDEKDKSCGIEFEFVKNFQLRTVVHSFWYLDEAAKKAQLEIENPFYS
ncbi:hypothetical protein [Segetibacter aerophilus]|uniref:Uncharacterized protein n=1 Tax=Segetibacter aerophilus TaxID=670293 RepID=A0A512B8M5_9BACT|nr:hypothetical protein [Segetibacter aerophilus]GEO08310.1 hypothetical protein SAE01_08060 [Segetibacter aerophilus]